MDPITLMRIDEGLLDSDGDLALYNGAPFSGIGFDPFPDGEGIEYETTYRDGLPHGFSRRWYSPGKLAYEVECKNGATHGKEIYWHHDGKIKSKAVYEFGIKISFQAWDEQGKLIEQFTIDPNSTNYELLENFRRGL